MAKIEIKWGHYVDEERHLCWGPASYNGNRQHIVPVGEPYQYDALCGKTALGITEFASGVLCPDCAKVRGIKSVADLLVDQKEYEWMNGQPDGEHRHSYGSPVWSTDHRSTVRFCSYPDCAAFERKQEDQ